MLWVHGRRAALALACAAVTAAGVSCSPEGVGTISAASGKDKLKVASKIGTKAPAARTTSRQPRGR